MAGIVSRLRLRLCYHTSGETLLLVAARDGCTESRNFLRDVNDGALANANGDDPGETPIDLAAFLFLFLFVYESFFARRSVLPVSGACACSWRRMRLEIGALIVLASHQVPTIECRWCMVSTTNRRSRADELLRCRRGEM